MRTQDEILSALASLVRHFEGREYSGDITAETLFFADLGFVSIDAIVLGERLDEHFGVEIPFAEFLGELAEQNVQDIRLGQLAEFLCRKLPE